MTTPKKTTAINKSMKIHLAGAASVTKLASVAFGFIHDLARVSGI